MVKYVAPSLLALIVVATAEFASADNLGREDKSHADTPAASSVASCSAKPLIDDVLAGVDLVADASCTSGAVGCLGTMCHFCQRWDSPFSAPLPLCKSLEVPTASQSCSSARSIKDSSLGLTLKSDPSCANSTIGCVRTGCRICRERDTPKSMSFMACSSIPDSTVAPKVYAGQEAVAQQGANTGAIIAVGGVCALVAIGGMVFAAKRMTRDRTAPEIITPSNSIAYQRASVFHI